ncbi:MAG: hypothetical protein FWE25_06825 [Lachnospiraceae bacterium]|nr:hypothetical protein [Lachnospiraceae bacterium]
MGERMISAKDKTFIIEIKDTQNGTWQGVITWTKDNQKLAFRSTLELIRLLDSAIETNEEVQSW